MFLTLRKAPALYGKKKRPELDVFATLLRSLLVALLRSFVIEAVVLATASFFLLRLGFFRFYLFLCKKKDAFMKTTSEYLQLLKQFKDSKAKSYGISKIGLFGSVARGEHKEGSDVDVCFEGVPKGFFAIGGIKVDLEQLFGCSVDVVRLREKMDAIFKEQIMKEVIYV